MNNGAKLVICFLVVFFFSEALQERCQTVVMYADVKRSQNKSHASSPCGMPRRDRWCVDAAVIGNNAKTVGRWGNRPPDILATNARGITRAQAAQQESGQRGGRRVCVRVCMCVCVAGLRVCELLLWLKFTVAFVSAKR